MNNQIDIHNMFHDMNRFMFHIILIHILTYMVDPNYTTTNYQAMRTVFVTVLAIFVYYVLLKSFITKKLNDILALYKNKQYYY
jgi:hypothetical protein